MLSAVVALSLLLAVVSAAGPIVTLNHGGQLRGKSFDFDGLNIDLFLGVRYAEPPIGSLRFQKPQSAAPWSGIKDVISSSNVCPQFGILSDGQGVKGDEDCLFMDITVPGGVDSTNKKPVMVFIHGGGYTSGSKDAYIGAPLAKHGDVIVVAINYRLDILGFLSDGPGTGNFGLWDQRAALVWVQDNIAEFGGDPDLVTIFGESAGAGSVAAQTVGQHNDGLFKRAIQESGSLYNDWGWYLSEKQRSDLVENIKKSTNCPSVNSIYACLRQLSVGEIFKSLPYGDYWSSWWHPVPDGDFFSADVVHENYLLSRRFDLLSGFNGEEGAFMSLVPLMVNQTQESIDNGMSAKYVDIAMTSYCNRLTHLSVNLCKSFYSKVYGLDTAADDKERGIRMAIAMGETSFNVDAVKQLIAHSGSTTKSTYAYHFVERFSPAVPLFPILPNWLRESAMHGDELPFVLGSIYTQEHNIWEEYFGPTLTPGAVTLFTYFNRTTAADKPLTDLIMTLWTNFAKTGNPNQPMVVAAGVPMWPEFNTATNKFIQLNSTTTVVIETPHKDRLDELISTISQDRKTQVLADKAVQCATEHKHINKDTVVG